MEEGTKRNWLTSEETAEIVAKAGEMAERAEKQAITTDNAKSYDPMRAEANAFIKDAERRLKEAREEYLKPFEEAASPIKEAIEGLKEANKGLSERILEAKKGKFRQEMEERWFSWAQPDEDGDVPSFDEAYDPRWFQMTKKDAELAMAAALRKAYKRKRKMIISLTFECSEDAADEIDALLARLGIKASRKATEV